MSATELVRLYSSGQLSPVEVLSDCLRVVERRDGRLNAFRFVADESALAEARAAQERWRSLQPRGRLDGVPVAIKDTFPVAGWSTMRGSRTPDPTPATQDAPAIERLRRAGAIFVGRTTTSEFGWKGVTDSPLTGVTRNPWNEDKTPGGSSGGSAVAVATGMSVAALGNDGGGSVRIPAAFTATVGVKASHGRVPVWPGSVLGELAHTGPIARTTADAALLLDVLSGPHPLDWTSAAPAVGFASSLPDGVQDLRVGVLTNLAPHSPDPAAARAMARAGSIFEELGARVSETSLPFADPVDAFSTQWFAGMGHTLAFLTPQQRELVDPELRSRVAEAGDITAADLFHAKTVATQLRETMGLFHEDYDLLVTPTVPIAAFDAGVSTPPGGRWRSWTSWTPLTYPFNLTQQPAISIPFGTNAEGLPLGLQVVAGKHRDDLVLRAAYAVEQASDLTDAAADAG